MHVVILVYARYDPSMNATLPLARRDVIAARLDAGEPVAANDLAAEFAVSEDAIRRDLRALAALGRCRRVYGGALPMSPATAPMAVRADEGRERKDALARAAATTIRPGEFVFLDSGSTNLALARHLPQDNEITVATNSVDIAAAVLARPDVRLVMIGGVVDPVVGGCVDGDAVQAVAHMNIDRCFVGACAISPDGGVSAFDAADAAFKRALAAASRERLVLATSDKLGARAPYRVVEVGKIGCFVVEYDADRRVVTALSRGGAVVLKALRPA
jgi:DeoR/GlpR family transcriptional regulator of sugar metabolism